jgi:glycosyltransferase involved in cell wall biosynthesis
MIKVSVIIPVYNAQKYLRECLDSVTAQTLKDIEIICVNDGSTDCSLEILESYAAKDSRFIVLTKENGGSAAARNVGLTEAQGEYIYFVDNDDLLAENTLEIYTKVADRDTLDVVYSNPNWICESAEMVDPYSKTRDPTEEQIKVQTGKELLTSLILSSNYYAAPWKRFIRRIFLETIGCRFFEQASPHEDNLFSFHVDVEAGKVAFIKSRLYTHRSHGFSTMIENQQKKNLGPKVVSHFICGFGIMNYVVEKNYPQDTKKAVMQRVNGLYNRAFELFEESGRDIKSLNWQNRWVEEHLFNHMLKLRASGRHNVFMDLNPVVIESPAASKTTILSKLADNISKVDFYIENYGWLRTLKRIVKK